MSFQLTRLMRGVTRVRSDILAQSEFQLTRLMRGVTNLNLALCRFFEFQLTRLMRGVTPFLVSLTWCTTISTHTPHARRDSQDVWQTVLGMVFQLTRLMRGVTLSFFISLL